MNECLCLFISDLELADGFSVKKGFIYKKSFWDLTSSIIDDTSDKKFPKSV